jgi:hypothetical protein
MKAFIALVVVSLFAALPAEAQKRGSKSSRPKTQARKPAPKPPAAATPRIIGTQVLLVTRNGDQIPGTLLELTAYSARIRQDALESTIALDTLASISFGSSPPPARQPAHSAAPARPEFRNDAEVAFNAFQVIADGLKTGSDYTDFGRLLAETRRVADRFIAKYSASENPSESRAVALAAAALTDYTWARTVWTLKFGRSGDGTVYDTDSPAITDALNLYPDLKAAAASGNKFSVDKIVAGLWRKAAEKTERARSVIASAR